MGILDQLPQIIADATGSLFQDVTLQTVGSPVSDGRGGFTVTRQEYVVKGQLTEYSDFQRRMGGIPEDARKLILQGYRIPYVPAPGDFVAIDGTGWKIGKVETVPGGAVYECEVQPDDTDHGVDLQAAISDTPALLASLEDTIASAGALLFEELIYYHADNPAPDARGGFVAVKTRTRVQGLVTDYSSSSRLMGQIPVDDRQAIISAKGVGFLPKPGDVMETGGGEYYLVNRVDTVPGKPIWQLRLSATTSDAAQQPRIVSSLSATLVGFSVAGVGAILRVEGAGTGLLDDVTLIGSGVVAIPSQGAAQVDDFSLGGIGRLSIEGSLSGIVLTSFVSAGSGDLPLEGQADVTLEGFTGSGQADQERQGQGISSLDSFTVNAIGAGDGEGTLSVSLDAVAVTAQGVLFLQGSASSGQVSPFGVAGIGSLQIAGLLSGSLENATLTGAGVNPVEGSSSASLDAFTSATAANLSIAATASVNLADATLTGFGGPVSQGASLLALQDVTLDAIGSLEIPGQANLTLDALTGSGAGTLAIEAQASNVLAAFGVTGAGPLLIESQGNGLVDSFVLTSNSHTSIGGTASLDVDAMTANSQAWLHITGAADGTLADFTGSGDGTIVTSSPPTLTIVQQVTEQDSNPNVTTITAPTAGNMLVVVAGHRKSAGSNVISDNGNNTGWVQHLYENVHSTNSSWRHGMAVWTKIADGTETEITVDFSDGECEVIVNEIDLGDWEVQATEQSVKDEGATANETSWGPISITGLSPAERLFVAVGSHRLSTDVDFTNFTGEFETNVGDTDMTVTAAFALDASGADYTTSATATTAVGGSIALVSMPLVSTGSPPPPPPPPPAPVLDANVQMAWDPVGSSSNAYGIGSHPDIAANYNLWPINGDNSTVDTAWAGIMRDNNTATASALVIDPDDLTDAGINLAQQDRSYSFWVRFEDEGGATPNYYREFFGQGANWPSGSGTIDGDHGLRVDGSRLRFNFNGGFNGQSDVVVGQANFLDGQWHHVVVSLSYGDFDFYWDGARVTGYGYTGTGWELTQSPYVMAWALNDALGAETSHLGSFSGDGDFDLEIGDIRLYNSKLNDAEALALFNDGRYEYAGQDAIDPNGDADANALIARMTTTPVAEHQTAIQTLVTDLKAGGVWSKLDLLQVYAAQDEQAACLNWINTSYTATPEANAVHVPYHGYCNHDKLNTGRVDTGFTMDTDGVNCSSSSASVGVVFWNRTGLDVFDTNGTRAATGGNPDIRITWANGVDDWTPQTGVNFDSYQTLIMSMDGTSGETTIDGVLLASHTGTATDPRGGRIMVGDNFDFSQSRIVFCGAALSVAEQLAAYNAFEAYMSAVQAIQHPDLVTLVGAITTTPTAARQANMNTLIRSLENHGVWQGLTLLSVLGNNTEQAARLNWKNPGTYDIVDLGTPAPHVWDGVNGLDIALGSGSGDADNCHEFSGFNSDTLEVQGSGFRLSNNHMVLYGSGDCRWETIAAFRSTYQGPAFYQQDTPTQHQVRNFNYELVTVHTGDMADGEFWSVAWDDDGSSAQPYYWRGVQTATGTSASDTDWDANQTFRLTPDALTGTGDLNLFAVQAGESLGSEQHAQSYLALEAYRTAIAAE